MTYRDVTCPDCGGEIRNCNLCGGVGKISVPLHDRDDKPSKGQGILWPTIGMIVLTACFVLFELWLRGGR